jgi:hypothetical protein
LIGRILERFIPWQMRRVRFDQQVGEDAGPLTAAVIDAFLDGARPALAGVDADRIVAAEVGVPWHRRPFFWEGQAFGATARHAITLRRGTPVPRYAAPGFRYMLYTGVGFWNGVAPRYKMPRMSLEPARWADVPDFHGFRALIAGGTSFAAVALAGRVDRATIDALAAGGDAWWRRGLLQGVGRAAWFLHLGDLPRLAALVEDSGEVGIAEGIGLAAAFTGLARPERIASVIDAMPPPHRRAVRKGITATLGVAGVDDPRIVGHLAALPPPLDAWSRQGAAAVVAAGRGGDLPERLDRALDDAVEEA